MERGIIAITENGAVTMPTAPVWMTQQEMSDAFNVFGCDIRRAIHAIYKNGELLEGETMRHVRQDDRICYDVYSLEMVLAVAFKLRTKECMLSESLSWKNCIPPVGKNHYTCSFRQRHIPERSITVDVKDIRPDTVRNTTRGHQVVFLLCTTMDAI